MTDEEREEALEQLLKNQEIFKDIVTNLNNGLESLGKVVQTQHQKIRSLEADIRQYSIPCLN